ncbi:MAG: hypothetical protein ACI9XO_002727 [Paraglaciecola sp.]|jgi:hypothetical protein
MKNVQLIVCILFISSFYSTVSAQGRKWEIGGSLEISSYNMDQKSNSVVRKGDTDGSMITTNFFVSRTILPQLDFGVGVGTSNLSYELEVDKTTHQLDETLQYSARPDFSKRPQILDKALYNNDYLTVPIFMKFKFNKNKEKVFQPSFGLRVDNFFLQKSKIKADFDRGDNAFINFFTAFLFGQTSNIDWDILTASQRQESEQYFEEKNKKFAMNVSLSIRLDWRFEKVVFGIEPFFSIAEKKINKQVDAQDGVGMRMSFSVRL